MLNGLCEKTEATMTTDNFLQVVDKIEECFAYLEEMLYYLKIKKMKQIRESVPQMAKANKAERLAYYRLIFCREEIVGLLRDFSLRYQDVLQGKILLCELDLPELQKTEELFKELELTVFVQKGSRKLHTYAWGKIISSSGLPSVTHKHLQRAVVNSLFDYETVVSRQQWLEESLSGIVDNCLMDIKRQIKQKIIFEFYKYQTDNQEATGEKIRKIS